MYDEASLLEKLEQPGGEIILYQTEDGRTRIQVRMEDETVWLTIAQMAELFQVDKSGISRHLKNVYDTGELLPEATVAKFATVRMEGERSVQRELEYYNLDAIISVGYRVNSIRGTQFRIWATQRLWEYIIKGFTLDDERLKESGGGNYFDELLARIRDIRSSEKVFWRKVLDIYATSIDYDSKTDLSPNSLLLCRTRCTGQRTVTPSLKSWYLGQAHQNPIWVLLHGSEANRPGPVPKSPRITSATRNWTSSIALSPCTPAGASENA